MCVWVFSVLRLSVGLLNGRTSCTALVLKETRAGKNLWFLKRKVFRFLGFLGFNVYAQSHPEHWTQEYDQLKSYRAYTLS